MSYSDQEKIDQTFSLNTDDKMNRENRLNGSCIF